MILVAVKMGDAISLATRMLIVAVVVAVILTVAAILLIQKSGTAWVVAPLALIGTLIIAINYLYWRRRYKARH